MATHHRAHVLDDQIAVLAASLLPQKDIAARLRVHRNTISRRLAVPSVQARIAALRAEAQQRAEARVITTLQERFDAAAESAFQRLHGLMEEGPPGVSLRAAESVLDRSSQG